jgi:hypothetical protein
MPWYAVSCDGSELVTATGAQIATTGFQHGVAFDAFSQMTSAQSGHAPPSESPTYPWLLAVPVVAFLGALGSLVFARGRGPVGLGGRVAMGAGLVAVVVQALQTGLLAHRLKLEKDQHAPTDAFSRSIRAALDIKFELHAGWWLSLVAAVAGSALATVAWQKRGAGAQATPGATS